MTLRPRHAPFRARARYRGVTVACAIVTLALAASIASSAEITVPLDDVSAVRPMRDDAGSSTLRRASTWWLSLGALSGSTSWDGTLANYQWDVRPQAAWGIVARAGRGRWSASARLWTTSTTQGLGAPGLPVTPHVRATSWELTGEARVLDVAGLPLLATASGGRLHLGYDPEHVSVDPGTGTPIDIDFRPIDEWTGGFGLATRHALRGPWMAGLAVEREVFALDAAHRNGDTVTAGREAFGNWSARLELSWFVRQP
jgi:hypothetical protein